MPAQKSGKLVKPVAKPIAKKSIKPVVPAKVQLKVVKTQSKPPGPVRWKARNESQARAPNEVPCQDVRQSLRQG